MELNTRKLEGIWKGLKVIAFKEQEWVFEKAEMWSKEPLIFVLIF